MLLTRRRRRTRLPVLASGKYWLDVDPELKLVPASRRDVFTVRLPAPTASATHLQTGTAPRAGCPRVFISYSQESHAPGGANHKADVIRLRELLTQNGIDVLIDQEGLDERRNWQDWTNAAITRSDFTILVASPSYLAAE